MGRKVRIPRYVIDERLRRLRLERNLRREEIAVKVGVSLDTISRWEQGDPVKDSDCRALAKALGVSFEELTGSDLPTGAIELPVEYVKAPLLGTCPASDKEIVHEEIVEWEWMPRDELRGQRVYLLRARGDSMNRAGIDDGDKIVVFADAQPENGDIVVARIDGECTIKRYAFDGKVLTLSPDSTNPKHQPRTFTKKNEVLVRGVVRRVWMKRLK